MPGSGKMLKDCVTIFPQFKVGSTKKVGQFEGDARRRILTFNF